MRDAHRVEKISLDSLNETPITVAGTGGRGSAQNQLNDSWGIFVDTQFNLYVADAENNRVQLFRPGQLNGITVAGRGVPGCVELLYPIDVVLDMNGYLYIADNKHNRVVRVMGDEYLCIAGCSGKTGSAANELHLAYAVRLDSQGHLYVADEFNRRIQRFDLINNGCGELFWEWSI